LPSRARIAIGLGALSVALIAAPASGQESGNGFLLGTPLGSLSIRGGYDHAMAGSDMFTDPQTIGLLSLSKRDFSSGSIAADVGAGGGLLWYRFRQAGDFIDFASSNSRIYSATTESSGWTAEGHAFAGIDYSLSPRLALTGESRYTFGRGPVSSDYVGFQRID